MSSFLVLVNSSLEAFVLGPAIDKCDGCATRLIRPRNRINSRNESDAVHSTMVVRVTCSFLLAMMLRCVFSVRSERIDFGPVAPSVERSKLEQSLEILSEIELCPPATPYRSLPIQLDMSAFRGTQQKADLISRFLHDSGAFENKHIVSTILKNTLESDRSMFAARAVVAGEENNVQEPKSIYTAHWKSTRHSNNVSNSQADTTVTSQENILLGNVPWWKSDMSYHPSVNDSSEGFWSKPYYSCHVKKWLVSYTCALYHPVDGLIHRIKSNLAGLFVIDVDVSRLDVNQCDALLSDGNSQLTAFLGTHKCDINSSQCIFSPGKGWIRGSYTCQCRDGFYSTTTNPLFNGSLVETTYRTARVSYSLLFVCRKCAIGCYTCTDASKCLSEYNWPFRISLLTISMLCIALTLLLIGYVYHYRKLKVIKVASPIFLSVTLLGCVIMYMEMIAIFPVLDVYSCIATKWTRHLGFCVTYSALLLKTWRVSLTYRVKSAHKIKLTDKQLLHWLFPILLVMLIYLSTWTVSSPPQGEYIKDYQGLKFKQCTYNWWDHCLGIGEVLFLLWGIKVCYNVRNAETLFNEARHISYAIYNIAIVNIIMVAIHLLIFPHASPDMKYLLGFVRTQLSTTVTITLIFGPKFHRVLKGQGDVYDSRARARGVTASFSLNGIGLMHEEPTDLYQENEELKEEIQKLAAQIEFMKIVHMEMNNRHLKPKAGGYFNQTAAAVVAANVSHSPVARAVYMRFESADTPTSRISPAAELISERV
uniref:G-protein coupled receptors family 3 profile domain-containing protein n=1 Tax=Strigamia maritima TaxID=126957 RepID=T1J8C6_STRMM